MDVIINLKLIFLKIILVAYHWPPLLNAMYTFKLYIKEKKKEPYILSNYLTFLPNYLTFSTKTVEFLFCVLQSQSCEGRSLLRSVACH